MADVFPPGTRILYRPGVDQEIHRGDIVVVDLSAYRDPLGSRGTVVQRVIGVGGDTVVCCDSSWNLVINGKSVVEGYAVKSTVAGHVPGATVTFSAKVPEGTLFLAGDIRNDSLDSRAFVGEPGGGAVPLSEVYGVVAASGSLLAASPLPPVTAFTDAGLPGAPVSDGRYRMLVVMMGGGAMLFLAGFIASIVTAVLFAGRRRRAASAPPAH
ncbi:signal peptidase I [Amycolatopsis sp. H20-H5]|uniref:signal peptidase I n=1 Tax=Amycolatopsis sp. H20-H5 TaxID=3046309 RepID=UPI002DBECA59|nr:signal peptidase I [Amycolatopsis sp. H20-H5]MEC3976637.1 signal peptidase I [Amycolatopsis sp. H20-H5]